MTATDNMPASGVELILGNLADRLAKQEEISRRLEASLFALARIPSDSQKDVSETPRPSRTPPNIPWPNRRHAPDNPRSEQDEQTAEGDILWAIGGLVPEALVGLDGQGLVRMWNPAAEDLFGWSAEEIIGKPLAIVPDDQLHEHEQLCADARNNQPRHDVSTVRRCKDGRLVRTEMSIAGTRSGIAITFRPISMPARSVTVEHSRPGTIPADLHLHGLAAVGKQVAAVTHDFNNLLTIISGGVESLLEQFDEADTRRSVIEMVDHAGKQAQAICRNLLNLARIDATPKASCELTCDLSAVVASHAAVIEGMIGSERALILGLTDQPAEIAADPVRVGQVLLNLASNARDAMPEGGTLAIEVEILPNPEASIQINGPAAVLTVSDTGVGMDTETLSRAFEPFFTTKPVGHGTGLGLANVAEAMIAAGGVVIPESAPGTGTTIRLYFPLMSA